MTTPCTAPDCSNLGQCANDYAEFMDDTLAATWQRLGIQFKQLGRAILKGIEAKACEQRDEQQP